MSQPIEIKLPWPPRTISSNSRAHWRTKHEATAKARSEAAMLARNANVPCWPDASVLIEYYPPSLRGDVSNCSWLCKPLLDGLADAMGCDDKHFRVDYPTVFAGTKKGGEVVFRIYPNSLRAGV